MPNVFQVCVIYGTIAWCMLGLFMIIYGIQRSFKPVRTFPDGYDVIEQASAIVERCWLEDDGAGARISS